MKFAISCDEDPGDPGTTAGGIIERDLNIKVGNALKVALERCGQAVWFDTSITYVQRVARANTNGSDVLFACAHNAAGSPAAEGAVFVFCGAAAHSLGKQQLAAQNVGGELVAAGLVSRWGTYDEQVYECCAFNKDTVYCEFAFQTNPADVAILRQPDYPVRAGEAAARGLAKTYGFTYVGTTPTPTPAPQGDDDMLYVGPFHPLAASLKTFDSGSSYLDPSNKAHVAATLAKGATVAVDGYRYSDSPVQSSDLDPTAGDQPGPDYVWWHSGGTWVPDAILDTTALAGAPAAGLPATESLSNYFAVAGSVGPPGPDDDSAYATKADLAAVEAKIPTKGTGSVTVTLK